MNKLTAAKIGALLMQRGLMDQPLSMNDFARDVLVPGELAGLLTYEEALDALVDVGERHPMGAMDREEIQPFYDETKTSIMTDLATLSFAATFLARVGEV